MSDESPDQNSDQPEEESRPPITIYYQDQKMENLKTGLTSEDLMIAARLEKLREDRMKDVPKDNLSLEKRLADLKGITPGSVDKTKLLLSDSRSSTQKADDLLKQFLEELKIDKSVDPSTKNDIETGLASLKDTDENIARSDSEDEESAVNKLVQRYAEEAALKPVDERNSDDELESPHFDECDETNTWCIICNEDATLKCLDCEGDIYCYSCFHKGHEEWNMNHHKPVPFKKTSEE